MDYFTSFIVVIIFFVVAGLPISTGDLQTHCVSCCRSMTWISKSATFWLLYFLPFWRDKFGIFTEISETINRYTLRPHA